MDTIASKTLSGEISKEETVELLSDLMATSIMDKVNPAEELGEPEEKQEENVELLEAKEEPPKELEPPKEEEKQEEPFVINTEELAAIEEQKGNTQEEKKIDDSFYTKSMDLSEQDFETSDDFEEKGLPIFVKILIGILIIAILAVAAYYVYLNLNKRIQLFPFFWYDRRKSGEDHEHKVYRKRLCLNMEFIVSSIYLR